ncbi:lachesin [Caerostris darwini]|uniref:Lachesin n=1 Tax=Caerostris darwini TaxID=1538125 RepID=A0AAV4Q5J3_9ARAC|nr:lachesin [Caerostris darwini]
MSSDTVVEERSKLSLRCEASGDPKPKVSWRREDKKVINLGLLRGRKHSKYVVSSVSYICGALKLQVEGEYLNISVVSREHMAAYLCIASNGVAPAVSKRIVLQVNFRPKIRIPNRLVGAATGSDVTLECRLEASPSPLTSWVRSDGIMLVNNSKYEIVECQHGYKVDMKIKIRNVVENDFGSYKCLAKNTLAAKEGFIRLYKLNQRSKASKKNYTALMDEFQEFLSDKKNRSSDSDSEEQDEAMPSSPSHETSNSGGPYAVSASLSIVFVSTFFLWL